MTKASNLTMPAWAAAGSTVRVGAVMLHGWHSLQLQGGFSDTFVFHLSPRAGLPPRDYAHVVWALAAPLKKMRRNNASLWVQVGGSGSWFVGEVSHALGGLPVPVAVTNTLSQPQAWEFSFFPWVSSQPLEPPRPAKSETNYLNLGVSEMPTAALSCLRVLARADCAYTAEIASLAGLSRTTVRPALHYLVDHNWVDLRTSGRYPLWKLRRGGLSLALRSWGLPPGHAFPERLERGQCACRRIKKFVNRIKDSPPQHSSAGRHRCTARLWPAWLSRAWTKAQIWAGWSEVGYGRLRPDALCWGKVGGYESLFWLEVEGGNTSRHQLQEKTTRRVNQALVYARQFQLRLVFVILGPPWVRREVVRIFHDLPEDLAVVLEDWKHFGQLPVAKWGRVRWE